MSSRLILAAVAALSTLPATADTLVQWNFNSPTPDANTGTGTLLPAQGSGTASLVGGATATFASGDASGGSSDPASGDDSAWNTSTFAAQGSGDLSRGAGFAVSTAGFEQIVFSYDLRHSNTSSRFEAVQYTLDGLVWTTATVFDAGAGGDTWYNARTVDLSAVAGAADNSSFALRVLATFAPGTGAYAATSPAGTYGASGTWRFDMVTVSGTPIPAVPEPGTWAMLLAGLGAVTRLARRRG